MALTDLQLDVIIDAQQKRSVSRAGLEIDLSYHRRQIGFLQSLDELTPRQRIQLDDHRNRAERCKRKLMAWGFL